MDDDVLTNNKNFFVKLGTRLIPGVVTEIVNTIDVNTGEEKPAALLKKNEIAVCKISLADVIVVDEFNLHKTMGELKLMRQLMMLRKLTQLSERSLTTRSLLLLRLFFQTRLMLIS